MGPPLNKATGRSVQYRRSSSRSALTGVPLALVLEFRSCLQLVLGSIHVGMPFLVARVVFDFDASLINRDIATAHPEESANRDDVTLHHFAAVEGNILNLADIVVGI